MNFCYRLNDEGVQRPKHVKHALYHQHLTVGGQLLHLAVDDEEGQEEVKRHRHGKERDRDPHAGVHLCIGVTTAKN